MKFFKPKFWDKENYTFLALLLLPISIIYQFLFFIKIKMNQKKEFSVPVICVGNIYLGGTGKTPLSIKICEILKNLNKNPAIVRKFYKGHDDEISLIKNKIKNIFTDNSRIKAINFAIENNFNTIILDDGFQDHSIKKNLNILCFNEKQLVGNGLTLPAGPLRESLNSIKRSNIVFINGDRNENFEKKIKKLSPNTSIYYTKYLPLNIEKFKNKNYLAFAGISNPKNFFDLLTENNLDIKETISFPDHYQYTKKDMNKIFNLSKKNNLNLITTEKDFYRLKNLGYNNVNYLNVELKVFQEDRLIEELKGFL